MRLKNMLHARRGDQPKLRCAQFHIEGTTCFNQMIISKKYHEP